MFVVHKWKSNSWVWETNIEKDGSFKFGKARLDLGQGWRMATPHDHRYNSITRSYDYAQIVSCVYDGSAQTMKAYNNGVIVTNRTGVNSSVASNANSLQIKGASFYGDVLFYRNALSDGDRKDIEGYLAAKYSMQAIYRMITLGSLPLVLEHRYWFRKLRYIFLD